MKKLTKKLLHELAISMPIIDEMEQQNFMGGTFYYDYSGNYLGSSGPGSDIRVATNWGTIGESIGFSEAAPSVVGGVLTSMANSIGYSGTVGVSYYDDPGKYAQAQGGQITYNLGSPSFGQDNYYDFLCTLLHENHHVMTPEDAGSPESEYYAYQYEMTTFAYSQASDEYKTHAINAFNHYRDKLGY